MLLDFSTELFLMLLCDMGENMVEKKLMYGLCEIIFI